MRRAAALAAITAACAFHPLAEMHRDAPADLDVAADVGLDGAPDTTADVPDAAPFCDATDPDLVACYELDGTTHDASSHHLDGSMTNVAFGPGKVGMALHHTATTAVDVPENPALDIAALTIEAWIDPDQLPAAGARMGIVDNQNQWGFFLHENGDLACTAQTTLQVQAHVATNTWTHVACTYDGAATRIYVNGTLAGSAAATGPLPTGGTDGMSIGSDNPPGAGSPMLGWIDQLRIFSVARGSDELCADAGCDP